MFVEVVENQRWFPVFPCGPVKRQYLKKKKKKQIEKNMIFLSRGAPVEINIKAVL